jgi:hypothetical protein
VTKSPIPINLSGLFNLLVLAGQTGLSSMLNGSNNIADFHPMKGPMTTQTLRGLRNFGAMHWRGDRSTGPFGTSAFDANVSFKNFIVAFQGLVGSEVAPSDLEMQSFADFQLQVMPPPNPSAQSGQLADCRTATRTGFLFRHASLRWHQLGAGGRDRGAIVIHL